MQPVADGHFSLRFTAACSYGAAVMILIQLHFANTADSHLRSMKAIMLSSDIRCSSISIASTASQLSAFFAGPFSLTSHLLCQVFLCLLWQHGSLHAECTSMISFQKSKRMIYISVLVTPILNHADLWSLVPIRTSQTCLLHYSSWVPIALFIHGYPEPWWLLPLLRAVWSNSMIFTRSAVWYFYFHGLLIAPSLLFKSYAPG
jgi:hypothetical protein